MSEANDKANANEKDSLVNRTQASENLDDIQPEEYCRCCCCLCGCSRPEYEDLTCFGCLPIKCGIYCIGLFAVFLTLFIFAETFTHFISENIAWWYVLICILLQIPLIISVVFFLNWIGDDTYSTRGKLRSACILTIISYSLQSIWSIIYFLAIFKKDNIIIAPETKFAFTANKRLYLFWTCFITIWVNFAFGYFICVVGRYAYRLRDRSQEKKDDDNNNQTAAPVVPPKDQAAPEKEPSEKGSNKNEDNNDAPANDDGNNEAGADENQEN